MAYNITRSDPNAPSITVDDNFLNTQTSVDLVGRNKTNYGETIATTQVHELENFASAGEPRGPIPGQLWFDKGTGQLKVNTGPDDNTVEWSSLAVTGAGGGGANLGGEGDPYGSLFVDTIGSPTTPVSDVWGGTFHGTATQAQYADLAERFEADGEYAPGTVVRLGGKKEITATLKSLDPAVLGVIAEKPAFMMNAKAGDDKTHPYVAMAGRVQVLVKGRCRKGDRITSFEGEGIAFAPKGTDRKNMDSFSVIGRALETKTTEEVTKVWIVVGAK